MGDESRVALMAVIRLLVGIANFVVAYLMYRSGSPKTSTTINGMLGSVMPVFFVLVMGIGLSGFVKEIPVFKTAILIVAAGLIVYGTR